MPTKQHDMLPVLALLLGATMWGVVWYPLRLLEQAGVGGLWQAMGISIPPALIMSWTLVKYRQVLVQYAWPMLGLAVVGWWVNTSFILAVLDGNVMRVLLLFYLSPLWTVLLGVLVLKERLTRQSMLVLVVAVIGGGFMLVKPGIDATPISTSDWLALSSGVAFSFYNLFIRKMQDAPVMLKADIAWFGGVIGCAVAVLVLGTPAPTITVDTALGVIAVGLFGILFMTLLVQYGVTHMPVQRSAIILLFELVAGALSQRYLTDEVLLMQEWVGAGLIVAAALLAARAR